MFLDVAPAPAQSDTVTIALAVIGALVAITNTIVGALILIQSRANGTDVRRSLVQGAATHELVNSRTSELITASVGQAAAEGILQGEAAERGRGAAAPPPADL